MYRNQRENTRQTEQLQLRKWTLMGLFSLSMLLSCTQAAQFPIPRGIYVPPQTYTENVPHSGDIIQVGCTDSGGVPLQSATYSITGGDLQNYFTINSTSGQISWSGTQTLDYEATPFLLFDIMCVDNSQTADTSNTATARVNVSVGPVNEFIPEIRSFSTPLAVFARENAPAGTILVSTQPGGQQQYSVTDDDDGPDGIITYTLSNTSDTYDGLFTVDRENGALRLARQLDVDNIRSGVDVLSVRIIACDTDPPRAECRNLPVAIIVQSAADNDPMFSENQHNVAVVEDTPVGSTIATVMCSDQDSEVGAYGGMDIANIIPPSTSAEDQLFLLDSSPPEEKAASGELILQGELDYDTTRLYNITLRCYDNQASSRQAFDLAQVVVMVIPVNDEPPVFENSFYSFPVSRISASGVDIGQVVATDRDQDVGGEISYSILKGDTDNFGVRPDGMVYLKDFVFRFEGDSFELEVMVNDGKFNATTQVTITVTGFLSIPEIVIIALSAVVFFLLIIVAVVIVCICCYYRRHPSKKISKQKMDSSHKSNFKGDMTDGEHRFDNVHPPPYPSPYPSPMAYPVPVPVPVPAQYEPVPRGPLLSVSQNPQWGAGSVESLSSANDEVDQISVPPSPGIGPVLQEVVDHFKEGDKVIGVKPKKNSKSEK